MLLDERAALILPRVPVLEVERSGLSVEGVLALWLWQGPDDRLCGPGVELELVDLLVELAQLQHGVNASAADITGVITPAPQRSQFFLLTPKLLPHLPYTSNVTVLIVFNGAHMCGSEEWDLEDFIRRQRRHSTSSSSSSSLSLTPGKPKGRGKIKGRGKGKDKDKSRGKGKGKTRKKKRRVGRTANL